MPPTSLFPVPEIPIVPVERPEPLLWIRRIVLIDELSSTAKLLRDPIEFRPGLNIIRVAKRPKGETRRIGNSVGKTLLIRLMRYSLGEAHFGTTKTVLSISKQLLSAYVLAEIRLNGETWVTCRPLRDSPIGQSFCVLADDWRAALEPDVKRSPFVELQEAIATSIISPLPVWQFPGEGRSPRWLDALGWLARDQECRFQYPNEWRDPEARSGTGRLDRDDASLLSAWLMGLLDTLEIKEQEKRSGWQSEKASANAEAQRQDRYLDSVRPMLCYKLYVTSNDLDDGVSETVVQEAIDKTKRALESEQRPHGDDDEGGELHDAVVSKAATVRVAETDLVRLNGLLTATREQLRACREMPRSEYLEKFNIMGGCPLTREECPKNPACTNTAPDPDREAKVVELQDHLARYNEEHNDLSARLPTLKAAAETAKRQWQDADRVRRLRLVELGRADALADDYSRYRAARTSRDAAILKVAGFQKQIDESLERRRAARGEREKRRKQLDELFDRTMKELIGPDAGGGMTLDARGLHPAPDTTAGVSGAGLGTLAAVIGFDLACLAGAISGVGHHPGFVIHDSPRNAEIEDLLYARVFEWVRSFEALYGTGNVGFQYIITTTTAPPASCDGLPFVRLTLDAREDDGLLLGIRW